MQARAQLSEEQLILGETLQHGDGLRGSSRAPGERFFQSHAAGLAEPYLDGREVQVVHDLAAHLKR